MWSRFKERRTNGNQLELQVEVINKFVFDFMGLNCRPSHHSSGRSQIATAVSPIVGFSPNRSPIAIVSLLTARIGQCQCRQASCLCSVFKVLPEFAKSPLQRSADRCSRADQPMTSTFWLEQACCRISLLEWSRANAAQSLDRDIGWSGGWNLFEIESLRV